MNGLPPIVKERPPEGTRRVLLTVSYDGTAYAGWQWQDNALSVQQVLEEALARLTGEKTRVTGASRTDAGVHALGQRAHFDTASRIPPDKYPFALNTLLPPDIRVLEGFAVPADFHARFDARGKRYTYRIHNAPHASALMRSLTAHVPRPLDMDRMSNSLPALLGTHDFAAFQDHRAHPEGGLPAPGGPAHHPHRTGQCLFIQHGAHHRGHAGGYRHGTAFSGRFCPCAERRQPAGPGCHSARLRAGTHVRGI